MKVIDGELTETTYSWPKRGKIDMVLGSDSEKDFDQKVPNYQHMNVEAEKTLKCNQVTYISDQIGLHRVGNKSDRPAVSLHLYTPPYSTCQLFDEKTGKCHPSAKCNFFSKDGHILP
jgi:cysteine dioxygenase